MAKSFREALIEQVITQIEADINMGDYTAIDGLLAGVPEDTLLNYLPEEDAYELAANYRRTADAQM